MGRTFGLVAIAGIWATGAGGAWAAESATPSTRATTAPDPVHRQWPQWGRDPSRNMVSLERGLPELFDVRKQGSSLDQARSRNIQWIAKLGNTTYSTPAVAGGRVFVGTNADVPDPPPGIKGGGAILCFDAASGQLVWRLGIPRYVTRDPLFNYDHLNAGVCSSPTVEGDRVYIVSNRGEVLCLDAHGQANGNDGPFRDEGRFSAPAGKPPAPVGAKDGDIIWKFDMLTEKHVSCWPQDAVSCSPLIVGDLLYVCTSNGVDKSHKRIPRPDAPSIIALDKQTGALVAADDARIAPKIFHGEWSSPALARIDGRDLIIHGGGDGWCYAMQAAPSPGADGKPAVLKTAWKFDCNPPEYRMKAGKALAYKATNGPSEIIATPVVWNERVYVSIGQDPAHRRGVGCLVCIDPRGSGDITKTGLVWSYTKIERSLSTVSIADGLLFVADFGGIIHCLDARSGALHWTFDTESAIWGSTLVADGKVYVGTVGGEVVVLAASRERRLIHRTMMGGKVYASPVAADGTLYFTTAGHLIAARAK